MSWPALARGPQDAWFQSNTLVSFRTTSNSLTSSTGTSVSTHGFFNRFLAIGPESGGPAAGASSTGNADEGLRDWGVRWYQGMSIDPGNPDDEEQEPEEAQAPRGTLAQTQLTPNTRRQNQTVQMSQPQPTGRLQREITPDSNSQLMEQQNTPLPPTEQEQGDGNNTQSQAPQPEQYPPQNQRPPRHDRSQCRKNTKASIKIAGLNIRGHGNMNVNHEENKWSTIKKMVLRQRIGILVIGEAHMDAERREEILKLHGADLKIFYSKLPNTANAAGVAIVLNKNITNTEGIQTHEIIPGHAMLMESVWHGTEKLTLLALYAPCSDSTSNAGFWKKIKDFFENNPRITKPDIVLGDLNMVEEPLDRNPIREDPSTVTDAFDDLKTQLQLVDGWRDTYPLRQEYTYSQIRTDQRPSQARLDRIYVKTSRLEHAFEWKIEKPWIKTDHEMVSMKFTCEEAPMVGPGRWKMPLHILYDKEVKSFLHSEGMRIETDMAELENADQRTPERNPQTIWADFQTRFVKLARQRAKIVVPKIEKQMIDLKTKIKLVTDDVTLTDEERSLSLIVLKEALGKLIERRQRSSSAAAKANYRILGETMSKYWSNIHRERKPRDLIRRLRKPNYHPPLPDPPPGDAVGQPQLDQNRIQETENEYEKNSQAMADMMRDHHGKLQDDEILPNETAREEMIQRTLQNVNKTLTEEQREKLKALLSDEDVARALKLSANDKAPGLNGISYEVWKLIDGRYKNAKAHEKEEFNIVRTLRKVYNDIELNGMVPGTGFSESWMCPLYKKNDRAEIPNYRPISLLNSDYKIMTKALTIKLAEVAPGLINRAQAGFVPGRPIFDQVWLAKLVINLAEVTEQDGAIVALDQEKAYDKIKHDYLWQILQAFGFPEEYTNTIRALYSDAYTVVLVNGMRSSTGFKVRRGVRQGDPLSCLLFDLAIEPLGEALRQSNLKGINVPKQTERLIATFFADDTTVYLSKEDDFGDLEIILQDWCLASGAKFNINKTEIIPIGTPEYRDLLRQRRFLNGEDGNVIPEHIKIACEGEAIRSLGALIGNGICQVEPWTRVLEKIDRSLARWEKSMPTMEGRRLIISMIIGGMTQYLTKVQGMPKEIEARLEKRIKKFLWAEKDFVRVNKETVDAPIENGGRQVLDIVTRNEAIMVTWLQSYLNFTEDRATWTYIADELMARHIPQSDENIDEWSKINIFLQSWNVKKGDLPQDLKDMLGVAKKFGLRMEGLAFSREILRKMPIWLHREADGLRVIHNSKETRCLRDNHKVKTVGETETIAKLSRTARHTGRRNCRCAGCASLRLVDCICPYKCMRKATELLSKLPLKWNPMSRLPEDLEPENLPETGSEHADYFDWRITTKGTLADAFRIFTNGDRSEEIPAKEWEETELEELRFYTDGSYKNDGDAGPMTGSGIYCENDNLRNRAIKIPEELKQTNQTGEVIAIKECVGDAPKNIDISIHSDSRTYVQGLTKHIQQWEDRDFIGVANETEIRATVAKLREREATTKLVWVKGHAGIEGNEKADELANQGREKLVHDQIDLSIEPNLRLTGVKLSKVTQSLAYKAIRRRKMQTKTYREHMNRRATKINLGRAQACAVDICGATPSEEALWKSIRHKDFDKKFQYFLWMVIHNAYKVGDFWENIPNFEHRGRCSTCQVPETLEHILFECSCPGQKEIWELAQKAWEKRSTEWIEPTFGIMMSCGTTNLRDTDGKTLPGESRLYRILISESAYLIWKMRNKRVINGETPPSHREIENRWRRTLESRYQLDTLLTSSKFGRRKLSKGVVRSTWAHIVRDDLSPDQIILARPGVLVV